MWEKDKQILKMYRECMQTLMADVRGGQEVDWEDACAVESAKLQQYTAAMINNYKFHNPQLTSEKRQSYYTPRQPYHREM